MSVGLDGTKAATPIGTVNRLEAPGLHKVLELPGYEGIGQDYLIKNMSLGQGRSEVMAKRTSNPRR
ncbi:uncharacterized protein FFB20_11539 [Fusarium fujikuroi]|nr:uncharacterized protein FFE2_03488 [Fusarium fujikuroi]SCN78284.1 uncharacterized protein FFM5_01826 [Fusarium fujikuroi]SCN94640.1 uncharacterized protein FFC1_07067 [Fusarium fujikuroi]SCO02134.1 uncharacterized protein FFB20_11539 [Fusarium fujikuroi]SCO33873.1 uncharacterized protein FFMR_03263 [Fusarium fujikuroi]